MCDSSTAYPLILLSLLWCCLYSDLNMVRTVLLQANLFCILRGHPAVTMPVVLFCSFKKIFQPELFS